ncbi:MAG: hypothetical protein ACP6IP_11065 [Candidatus Njordarchaeia archaeon]
MGRKTLIALTLTLLILAMPTLETIKNKSFASLRDYTHIMFIFFLALSLSIFGAAV